MHDLVPMGDMDAYINDMTTKLDLFDQALYRVMRCILHYVICPARRHALTETFGNIIAMNPMMPEQPRIFSRDDKVWLLNTLPNLQFDRQSSPWNSMDEFLSCALQLPAA